MTDEQIKHIVDHFLGWRLPQPWRPDNGVSYERPNYAHTPAEHDWPTGTNLFDASQAGEMVRYMLEGLTTPPPSQGKVERAREIAHNIISYCREHRSNTDVLTYTRDEAIEYVTAAITAALTEPAQGTSVEALREAADKMKHRCYTLTIPNDEMSAYQADGYNEGWSAAIRAYRKAIRALPLPVSEDGSAMP